MKSKFLKIFFIIIVLVESLNSHAAIDNDTVDLRCCSHHEDRIVSIKIDMCNIDIETAYSITPQMYDEVGFADDKRDTVDIIDTDDIKCLIKSIKKLKLYDKYTPTGLDTRGCITISYNCGCTKKCYISYFFLYVNGLYYDISPRSFLSVDFRVIVQKIMNTYPRAKKHLNTWFFYE